MLTTQKRKFALALMSGKNRTASAIEAGYSEKSARCKGSQLAKDPEVLAFMTRKQCETVEVDEVPVYRQKKHRQRIITGDPGQQKRKHGPHQRRMTINLCRHYMTPYQALITWRTAFRIR